MACGRSALLGLPLSLRAEISNLHGQAVRHPWWNPEDQNMVDLTGASWNRLASWLQVVDALRRAA
jgi:hypothetical protein